jgi:hypothetical protein
MPTFAASREEGETSRFEGWEASSREVRAEGTAVGGRRSSWESRGEAEGERVEGSPPGTWKMLVWKGIRGVSQSKTSRRRRVKFLGGETDLVELRVTNGFPDGREVAAEDKGGEGDEEET